MRSACLVSVVALAMLLAPSAWGASTPYPLVESVPNPGTNGQVTTEQGYALAMDGDLAVVCVPNAGGDGRIGRVKVYHATSGQLLHTLSNVTMFGSFGRAVAVSGSRILVGAPTAGPVVAQAGAVYVFDVAGNNPTAPILTLTNPAPFSSGNFGGAVGIAGATVVVGAPRNDIGATDTGSAYVYDLNSPTPAAPVLTLTNPAPASSDQFGVAVGIAGNRVIVGANLDGATDLGSAYVYDLGLPVPAVPMLTLTNPTPAFGQFGSAVAMDGGRVVVGAVGIAHVFNLAAPSPAVTLTNPSPTAGDNYGLAVAISGTRVAVGAALSDGAQVDTGAAYLFDLGAPVPAAAAVRFLNPTVDYNDQFGRAVALSADTALVGAPWDDTAAPNSGSAYVYPLNQTAPLQAARILAGIDPAANDRFGYGLALNGSWLAVGTIFDNTGAQDAGRVDVFDLTSDSPRRPVLTLTNPEPDLREYFGDQVALSGAWLVVGARTDTRITYDGGSVWVYNLASATPGIPALVLPDAASGPRQYFGIAVALSGTRLLVGESRSSLGGYAGAVYLYDLTNLTPTVKLTLTNPAPAAYDDFGYALAQSGRYVVVGARGDDTVGRDTGAAYVFDLEAPTPQAPVATLLSPTPVNDLGFGGVVAISGTTVAVGSLRWSSFITNAESVAVYDLASATPNQAVQTLMRPGAVGSAAVQFGSSLSLVGSRLVVGAAGVTNGGAAYVFDLASATPGVPLATLSDPLATNGNSFGVKVAFDGTNLAVGAPGTDVSGLSDRGIVHIFGMLQPRLYLQHSLASTTISWNPTNEPGWKLQSADALNAAPWFDVPGGGTSPVVVPVTNISRFYRLMKP